MKPLSCPISDVLAPAAFALFSVLAAPLAAFPGGDTGGVPAAGHVARPDRLPLAFVENRGQWDAVARFVARRGPMVARLEPGAVLLQLERPSKPGGIEGVVLRLAFEGAGESVRPAGEGRLPGVRNYVLGNGPSRWFERVPSYAAVSYRGLDRGVDFRVYEGSSGLEYDLLLAPDADPERIVLRCDGAERLRVTPEGALAMETPLGKVLQRPPVAWEGLRSGERRAVACRFRLLDERRYGFEVEGREEGLPLVIDPGLEWSTFLGGSGGETAWSLAQDAQGIVTIAGETTSMGFPTTAGAYATIFNGGPYDAFVTRLDPSQIGSAQLLWSTYVGGAGGDGAVRVLLDSTGDAIVAGSTGSIGFPTTAGAYDTSYNGGGDAFVLRLNAADGSLAYSTLLGGSGDDGASGAALDPSGTITVAGWTNSADFPTSANAHDPTINGFVSYDAFVSRLDLGAFGPGQLVYSTYLGGSGNENWARVAVDASGAIVVAGPTLSADFPVTPAALDTTYNGSGGLSLGDAFVARLDPSLSPSAQLVWATYLGGVGDDQANGVLLDASGAVTVAGWTGSPGFPTSLGAYDTTFNGSAWDAYVARLDSTGVSLLYGTFLGGTNQEGVNGLALDASGTITISGTTQSPSFPTTAGAFDTTFNGSVATADAFVARIDPTLPGGGALLYSTFLGGAAGNEFPYLALALDATAAATVCGTTTSGNFPVTPGAFDSTWNGNADAFGTRIDIFPLGCEKFGASTPGCDGPLPIGVTATPSASSANGTPAFALTCSAGPPSGAGLLALALDELPSPFSFSGAYVWVDPTAIAAIVAVSSNALGRAVVAVPIPADPSLVGGQAFAQFFWVDSCASGSVSASNALAVTVQ